MNIEQKKQQQIANLFISIYTINKNGINNDDDDIINVCSCGVEYEM